MSTDNPYAFQAASPFHESEPGSPDAAVARGIQALIDTRPWVRIMGILTAIGGVLMGLAGCAGLAVMGNRGAGPVFGFFEVIFLVLYLGMAVLYGFAAKFLLGYGAAITRAEGTRSLNDIADALIQQKSFWKLVGISTVILIGVYLIGIVLVFAGGFALRGM